MRKFISEKVNKFKLMCVGLSASVMMPVGTMCSNIKIQEGADANAVMGGVIDLVIKIAFYVGVVLMASGIFQLILAYKDDNADGQSRAVRLVVVAIALIGMRVLLRTAGLIG